MLYPCNVGGPLGKPGAREAEARYADGGNFNIQVATAVIYRRWWKISFVQRPTRVQCPGQLRLLEVLIKGSSPRVQVLPIST